MKELGWKQKETDWFFCDGYLMSAHVDGVGILAHTKADLVQAPTADEILWFLPLGCHLHKGLAFGLYGAEFSNDLFPKHKSIEPVWDNNPAEALGLLWCSLVGQGIIKT